MKFKEIRVNQIIEDTWYNEKAGPSKDWGVGRVVKVSKSSFSVKFSNPDNIEEVDDKGILTYARDHAQFVRRVDKKTRSPKR